MITNFKKNKMYLIKTILVLITIGLLAGLSCTIPAASKSGKSNQSIDLSLNDRPAKEILTEMNPYSEEVGPFSCFWIMADDEWKSINSLSGITNDQDKILIADLQTTNGTDPAGLRFDNFQDGEILEYFKVKVEEEQSYDIEVDHFEEIIGGLMVDDGLIYDYDGQIIGRAFSTEINQENIDEEHSIRALTVVDDPVVFANIRSFNGNHPCHVRILNVQNAGGPYIGIKFKIEEWDYLCNDDNNNGQHAEERIDFIALKPGIHLLDDPYRTCILEVGKYEMQYETKQWEKIKLLTDFEDPPVIITQTQTDNGAHQIVTRNKDLDTDDDSFKVKIQEEEGRSRNGDNSHNIETVGYLAINKGKDLRYKMSSVIHDNGNLKVRNNTLCNEDGNPVQLKGMSSFWLNWTDGSKFVNDQVIDWLVYDWEIDIYRVAVGVRPIDPKESGELIEPYTGIVHEMINHQYDLKNAPSFRRACQLIDRCIDKGIYVIVDWHVHDAFYDNGNGITNMHYAKLFFAEMSKRYGGYPNVIFEIWNEPGREGHNAENLMYEWQARDPNNGNDTIDKDIKSYSEELIQVIRDNDSDNNDNIVIVPTPCWDQSPNEITMDITGFPNNPNLKNTPIDDDHVMYSFHFYAGSHTPCGMIANDLGLPDGDEFDPELLWQPNPDPFNKLDGSGTGVIPIFVTEWGTSLYDGGQKETSLEAYTESSDVWLNYLAENNISWCNWSISNKEEGAASLKPEAGCFGYWSKWALSPSGKYIRRKLRE